MILGVSFDSVEANAAFAEKYSFPYLLLCDTSRDIGVAYHAAADRSASAARRISYLIDPQGKIAKAWKKVDVSSHADDVLALI